MLDAERRKLYRERVLALAKLDPKVPIELGGQVYQIEFDNTAALALQEDSQFNLMTDALDDAKLKDLKFLGQLLFFGLRTNHPDLSLEQVNRMFTFRQYYYVTSRLKEATSFFLPDISDMEDEAQDEVPSDNPDPK